MTEVGGAGGVAVDPAALARLGGELAALRAELTSALDGLRAGAAGAAQAAGGYGAPQAYAEMWRAWDRELATLAAALGQLSDRVRASGASYQATEESAARRLAPGADRGARVAGDPAGKRSEP